MKWLLYMNDSEQLPHKTRQVSITRGNGCALPQRQATTSFRGLQSAVPECVVDFTDFYIPVNSPYSSNEAKEAESLQVMTCEEKVSLLLTSAFPQLKSHKRRQNHSHFLSLKSSFLLGCLYLNLSPVLTTAALFR